MRASWQGLKLPCCQSKEGRRWSEKRPTIDGGRPSCWAWSHPQAKSLHPTSLPASQRIPKLTYSLWPWGLPGGSDGKASARNAGDLGLIPGSGRSPGKGNGNPPQYSCLENSMDGGPWSAVVHGVEKSLTRLSNFTFFLFFLSGPCAKCPSETNRKNLLQNLAKQRYPTQSI